MELFGVRRISINEISMPVNLQIGVSCCSCLRKSIAVGEFMILSLPVLYLLDQV